MEADWVEVRRDFVKTFNKAMKDKDLALCQRQLDLFTNKYIPAGTRSKLVEWTLRPLELRQDTICLLAHSSDAKRALGVLNFNTSISDAIPDPYRFEFSVLVVKQKPVKTEGKKRKVTLTRLLPGTKNNEQLITPKRGCWFIWKPSLDMNITTENQDWHEATLIEWYEKFVKGMEQIPSRDFGRVRADFGFEQFMLVNYPSEEWREHTLTYKKKNKKQIRFNDEEDQTPPPPPPVLHPESPPIEEEPKPESKKRKKKKVEEEDEEEPIQLNEEELAVFHKFESLIREVKPAYSEDDLETLISTSQPTKIEEGGQITFLPIIEEEVMTV